MTMKNKEYILKEIEKSERFAEDQKYILDYCMKVRREKKKQAEHDGK